MFIKHRHYISCLIILIASFFCFTACTPVGKQYLLRGESAPNTATIYAMRAKQFQGGGSVVSFYDGPVHVGELGKNDYLVWSRPAGTAELCAYSPHNKGFDPVPLLLDVKSGRSYYVSVEMLIRIGGPNPISIHEIDENIARERMKSIDIAPKSEVVFTLDKAVAAVDKWPGPATRENRWDTAWPQLRVGMSIEELKSIGIFILDSLQPGGMFKGSITTKYADGSTVIIREDNGVSRTERIVSAHVYIKNQRALVVEERNNTSQSGYIDFKDVRSSSFVSYTPDELTGLMPAQNFYHYKYYGVIDRIKKQDFPAIKFTDENPVVSVQYEVSFGFLGYSIQLRQNKVVSVNTRKQRNPTR